MLGASTGRLRQPAGALTKGSSVDQQPQDSNDQNDRDPLTFEPGLSLVYTDEAHGHGNAGTDSPPAQSPLDAAPEPGSDTPELKDASFTDIATRARFTDSGAGHTDNYSNPEETSTDSRYDVTNPWRFLYGCLTFDVLSMTGKGIGPGVADGDLTGSVGFDMGAGCGEFDYGYTSTTNPPPAANTRPNALATATPQTVRTGQRVTSTPRAPATRRHRATWTTHGTSATTARRRTGRTSPSERPTSSPAPTPRRSQSPTRAGAHRHRRGDGGGRGLTRMCRPR